MEKELDVEDWMQGIQQKQNKEKTDFEQRIEKHDQLLKKYRVEVYNQNPPKLERLHQLERIITQFIDLLNSDKYNAGYHNMQLEGTFTGFLAWKQRLSERIISEYSTLLNSISVRAR